MHEQAKVRISELPRKDGQKFAPILEDAEQDLPLDDDLQHSLVNLQLCHDASNEDEFIL